jgi:hypothetical protein
MEEHSSSNGMICADRHAIVCLPLILCHVIEIVHDLFYSIACPPSMSFSRQQRAAGEGESTPDERDHERSDERPGLQRLQCTILVPLDMRESYLVHCHCNFVTVTHFVTLTVT